MEELATFVSETCSNSLESICTSAYTENPPFSCERITFPSFITNIATAFANTTGAWTFIVIALKILLKFQYPHGFHDFVYDEATETFLPTNEIQGGGTNSKLTNPQKKRKIQQIQPVVVETFESTAGKNIENDIESGLGSRKRLNALNIEKRGKEKDEPYMGVVPFDDSEKV
jgi:hypothetical protein